VYNEGDSFDLMKARDISLGNDVTIIASGIMVERAIQAAEILAKEGISAGVTNVYTWKPIDKEAIINAVKRSGAIVVAENHNRYNGLTSAVAEVVCENCPAPVMSVSVDDKFGEVGKMPYLSCVYNLNVSDIVEKAKLAINAKKA
ncbi:MAG: transketolase family protein, partial [Clostridia bacterium]|nr:transketolase family protein [Clostridia bacterium]